MVKQKFSDWAKTLRRLFSEYTKILAKSITDITISTPMNEYATDCVEGGAIVVGNVMGGPLLESGRDM